jgi:type I restriction enzyme, S subunit
MDTEKFKDLFLFGSKSKIMAGEGLKKGLFPFYTSSPLLSKWINTEQYFDEALILGTGGLPSIHYVNEPFATSTDCLVAIAKPNKSFNVKFVYYYIFTNIRILEQGFKGAGLKHISKPYIQNLDIPLPDLETQDKIVAVLDKAKNLIEKREQTIQKFNELLRSAFLDMFGDPILNTKRWEVDELKNLAKLERGRFSPRPRNDPSYFGGTYPYIQTGEIANSNYRLTKYTQTLNEKGIAVSKEFKTGTIVIAIVGATIGATAILEIDAFATDSIIGIKPKKEINNVFLEMLLRFQKQVLIDNAPEAARANINLAIIGKIITIKPTIELQNKYAEISSFIYQNKEKLNQSKKQLENLLNGLSQLAFNGELQFNTAVDLEVLLENDYEYFKDNADKKAVQLLLNRLDKNELNENKFFEQDLYDKAKSFVFELLKEDRIKQVYDSKSKSLKLTV